MALMPQPREITLEAGTYRLDRRSRIIINHGSALQAVRLLSRRHYSLFERRPEVRPEATSARGGILLRALAVADAPAEGYTLKISPDGIVIAASGEDGFLRGAQTLLQLIAAAGEGDAVELPALTIIDAPAFAWRGFMLDCSRHFMEKEFIFDVLDVMAYLKINVFHWHLIDNNGWRLEIDKYPLLTERAAWRVGEDGQRYGGYYTKEDVRDVIAHAASLGIVVIPEIEMPGHNTAALHAYPELTCDGEVFPVGEGGLDYYTAKVGAVPFCAGREETFAFLEDVLLETMELFPSPIIHIGGDERPTGWWSKCPQCQARMEAEGLKDEDELQVWFMRRITDFMAEHDRRAMTWAVAHGDPYNATGFDDIGNNALIQNWHDVTNLAARAGHEVVNSINYRVYFDYPQEEGAGKPSWMPVLTLEKTYAYNPIPGNLEPQFHSQILGGEACLWTELIPQSDVSQAIFPRLLAVAEILWHGQDDKDFAEFKRRVEHHCPILQRMGWGYHQPPTLTE